MLLVIILIVHVTLTALALNSLTSAKSSAFAHRNVRTGSQAADAKLSAPPSSVLASWLSGSVIQIYAALAELISGKHQKYLAEMLWFKGLWGRLYIWHPQTLQAGGFS